MRKLIFCNLDLLKVRFEEEDYQDYDFRFYDCNQIRNIRNDLVDALIELAKTDNNKVFFYSRSQELLDDAKQHFGDVEEFLFWRRNAVEELTRQNGNRNNYFVFVGTKNQDFYSAVNTKSLFIVPEWLPIQDRPLRYGIHVENVNQLYKFILTLNNQSVWYSRLEIDDVTVAYSLMDARYGRYARTYGEREMVQNFQRLLKDDMSRNYHSILLYHFLAGMTNSMEFDDIELFGLIPSSDCSLNPYVYEFMTQVRELKGKRLPHNYGPDVPIEERNLLIRHTCKAQNHNGGRTGAQRVSLGATDEFATLMINPDYRTKINNLRRQNKFNVCIFDDYMTYGNSFNAVRNMLEKIGANKIIFVSIGLFKNPFQCRDYDIDGDVYSNRYGYEEVQSISLNNYEINDSAKDEVSELHEIFNA